ncbi:MAG: HAMP domain-containing histidine kinase [Candidatus Nomurabacteria bacterium]|nr:HAMP domain-containing histidine kinase [Candidatus Nomurabacteria bacterium]
MAIGKRDKAVQTPITRIQGYWNIFIERAIYLIVIGQLFIAAVAAIFMTIAHDSEELKSIGIIAIVILELVVQLVVVFLILRPEKRLFNFICLVALNKDGPIDVPGHKWDETSGLAAIASFIQGARDVSATATMADEPAQSPTNYILSALEMTDVGIVVLDHNQRVVYRNNAAPVRAGFDNEQALDLLFDERDTVSDWVASIGQNAIKANKVWHRIPNIPDDTENRERRYYDIVANYTHGDDAETILMIVDRTVNYGRDEDDLNLIAFAAHELRGPVTVVRGYLDILIDEMGDQLTPDTRQLFERLTVSANRLSSYINNILNTSRYDQRHLIIHLAPQTVSAVLGNIIDDIELRASSQGRLLSVHVPEGLPLIAADISGLGEVLTNLVDNAIKYSREGGAIEVNASTQNGLVTIDVVDHGIGMPTNVVANLFKKFYRSHRSRGSAIGTGIGLYISKAIVEQHGGSLSVRSQEGDGSTFTVTLPTYDSIKDKLLDTTSQTATTQVSSGPLISNHGMLK